MSQVPPTSPYPQPGEVIDGKYKVERVLGQGGMGAVVKAVHLVLRAPVALKFMNPQYVEVQGAVDRFLNEGVASKRIASDHVLHVDDVGKLPSGAPYLVMDCLDGRDLAQVLEAEGKPGLPAMRAVGFVLQILRALQAAHATNIIHRDMKPSNCFVIHKDGDDDFVKILDFGISKIQDPGSQSLTQTHSALGTPLYMSAEQARSPKEVDARSDLYSVAVILYELLSGRTPFRAESGQLTELLFKLFTADPDPLDELVPDLPPGLWDVVRKGLAREPIDRYASALLFAEALEPFTDEKGRALIARMQRFVAPEDAGRASRAIPPSAVAFSELGKGASLGGTPLAGGVSQAQAEAAVRTLGMAGTEVDRRSSVPPPAPGAPPHGPAGTVAMPDRQSAMGGIAAPRVPRENDVTYPAPKAETSARRPRPVGHPAHARPPSGLAAHAHHRRRHRARRGRGRHRHRQAHGGPRPRERERGAQAHRPPEHRLAAPRRRQGVGGAVHVGRTVGDPLRLGPRGPAQADRRRAKAAAHPRLANRHPKLR
ncbi:MAG: serine/threonine protein kinase [Myxococcales bacterium]|nr:serine/threonine protein kinase [Myxococcales bacterium]